MSNGPETVEKLTNAKKLNELHRLLKDLSARVGALENRSGKVVAEVGGDDGAAAVENITDAQHEKVLKLILAREELACGLDQAPSLSTIERVLRIVRHSPSG